MFKKLLLWIILLIIIAAATPLAGGYLFKRDYEQLISDINKNSHNTKTDVTILEYRQGWLKSYAKVAIQSRPEPGLRFPTPQIILDQEIIHGPIIVDPKTYHIAIGKGLINSKFHLQPLDSMMGIANDAGLIQIHTLVDYKNNYQSTFTSPGFNKEIPGKLKFTWGGFNGTFNMQLKEAEIKSIASKFDLMPFSINMLTGPYIFSVSNLTTISDFTASSLPGLHNGTQSSTMNNISYSAKGKTVFELNNLNVTVKSNVNNNLLNLGINTNIARLNFPEEIEIKPASLNLALNDFNGSVLLKLMDLPYAERQKNITLFPALIMPTSNIKGDLLINTSKGKLSVTSDVNWKGQNTPLKIEDVQGKANIQVNLRISSELLNYIISQADQRSQQKAALADTNATAANPAAASPTDSGTATHDATSSTATTAPATGKLKAQVDDYVARGYLAQEKDEYVANIEIIQGKVKINGKEYVPSQSLPVHAEPPLAPKFPINGAPLETPAAPATSTPVNENSATPPEEDKAKLPTDTQPFIIKQDTRTQG